MVDTPRWRVGVLNEPPSMGSWQVLAGLTMLAARGEVELSYASTGSRHVSRSMGAPWLEVLDRETGASRAVCIDLGDGPDPTGERPAQADVTFKRTFRPDHVPEGLESRMRPYGLAYYCRSGLEGTMLGPTVRSLGRVATSRRPEQSFHAWAKQVSWMLARPVSLARARRRPDRSIPGIPRLVSQFEIPPSEPARPLVLFQTRLWPKTHATHGHRDATNDQRAELVRTLRRSLGDRFVGGLMPSELVRDRYPAEATDLPTDPLAYLALVRQCAVVVAMPGLQGSTGWRVPECMAASRAIVTMPIAHDLPAPLVEGEQVSVFTDPESAADACERLLAAPDLLQHRREQAWAYYQAEVRPDVLMRNRLAELSAACPDLKLRRAS
jgi:Glycosyl transferases group 1